MKKAKHGYTKTKSVSYSSISIKINHLFAYLQKQKEYCTFILVLTSIIYLHKISSLYACNARPPNYFIILNKEREKTY